MKHLFIINPQAGKGRTLEYIQEIEALFRNRSEDYIIEYTERPGHATQIVKKYTNNEDYRVYAVGGDGTINEVLNGMIGTNSSLAVIPSGSGNDFARSIYSNLKDERILSGLLEGKENYVDLGKVGERYFINISSAGMDAEIAYNATAFKQNPFIPSKFAYLLSIFTTVFKYNSKSIKMIFDDKEINFNTLLIAVANGSFYGGGMKVAPYADICDGVLDICHVKEINKLRILTLFPQLMRGKHEKIKEVAFYKTKKAHLICDEDISFNIDGEILKMRDAVFEIVPQAIKVVFPKV